MAYAIEVIGNGVRVSVTHVAGNDYYRLFIRRTTETDSIRVQYNRSGDFTHLFGNDIVDIRNSYVVNVAYSSTGSDGTWTFMGATTIEKGVCVFSGSQFHYAIAWVYSNGSWHRTNVWCWGRNRFRLCGRTT